MKKYLPTIRTTMAHDPDLSKIPVLLCTESKKLFSASWNPFFIASLGLLGKLASLTTFKQKK